MICYGSVVKSCLTLCDCMDWSMIAFPVLHYLPEFAQIHFHWASDAIQPSHPPLPSSLVLHLSQHQTLGIRWSKNWSFSFSISPSNEYSGLISFRTDCFDLLAVSPRDSQQSSPTFQYKSINFSVLSFLYGPILISIHDYWKNHSFDHTDLHWQSNVSAF